MEGLNNLIKAALSRLEEKYSAKNFFIISFERKEYPELVLAAKETPLASRLRDQNYVSDIFLLAKHGNICKLRTGELIVMAESDVGQDMYLVVVEMGGDSWAQAGQLLKRLKARVGGRRKWSKDKAIETILAGLASS